MKFTQTGVTTLGRGVLVRLEQVILQAPDGTTHQRDVLRHPGGVAVLPVDEGHVWLIRQFRVAVSRDLLEIPAGKCDVGGEPPLETAQRELYEEMGMTATDWVPLGSMEPSPGYADEVIHLFAASGIVAEARRPDGVEEFEAEIVGMRFDEALAAVDTGRITDAKTQIALMKWARRYL